MTWFKAHPIVSGTAAATLLAIGVLTYFALASAQRYGETVTAFNNEARQLDALKKQKPFPNQQNLKALQKSRDTYKSALATFRASLAELDEPPSEISPQLFQDELRKAVDKIGAEALKNNVGLPEAFYLGFDEFRTRLPSKDEAPNLDREFQLLKNLVTALIALPVDSIDVLERLPLAPSGDSPPITFNRFRISFSAPQEILIKAFNTISRNERFLLVRSVSLENSNPAPPAKTIDSADGTQASPLPPTPLRQTPHNGMARGARQRTPPFALAGRVGAEDKHGHFQYVLGEEFITATLIVDIPTFSNTPPEVPANTPKP